MILQKGGFCLMKHGITRFPQTIDHHNHFQIPLFSDNFFNSWSTFSWADHGCYPFCYFHSLFNLHNFVTQTSQGGLLAGQPWFWLLLWLPHRGTDLLHPHVRTSSLKLFGVKEADQKNAFIDKVQKMGVYRGQSWKHEFRENMGCVCVRSSVKDVIRIESIFLFHPYKFCHNRMNV